MKKKTRTVNISQARAQLSRLVDRASKGEPFIIARAGKPLVKVAAIEGPAPVPVRRLGFMAGRIAVPEDFDVMGKSEIERVFEGRDPNIPRRS
jgi:prevent-host-death family protein